VPVVVAVLIEQAQPVEVEQTVVVPAVHFPILAFREQPTPVAVVVAVALAAMRPAVPAVPAW